MKKLLSFFLLSLFTLATLNLSYAQQAVEINNSSSACVNLAYNMKSKSRDATTNKEVTKLQNFLKSKGYLTAKPNGNFGPATLDAVKSFQAANNLIVTGNIGAVSRAKIKEISCGLNQVKTDVTKASQATPPTQTQTQTTAVKPASPTTTNKTPGFIEIGKFEDPLISTGEPVEVGGKLAYTVKKMVGGRTEDYVVYDGKDYGKEYGGRASYPLDSNGKLVYSVGKPAKSDKAPIFVFNGEEYYRSYSSYTSTLPVEVNGKVAYLVEKDKKELLIYDGEELTKEYSSVSSIANINNKLAYVAANRITGTLDQSSDVYYDGVKVGGGYYAVVAGYFADPKLLSINGKLAYLFETKDRKSYIYYDGKEIGNEYDEVATPREVNGKLTFSAKKDGKYFVVFDGKEYGKEYDSAYGPVDIGGKLAFTVKVGQKNFIVYDGKEIGKEYSSATNPISVNGSLAYQASTYDVNKNSRIFIVYNGVDVSKEYGRATKPVSINGKLAYFVEAKDYKSFIVMEK